VSASARDSRLSLIEIAAIVAVIVVWGVNNAAAKVATGVLPPMLVGALRFAIAGAVLLPMVRPPFPQPKNLIKLAIFAGPLHFGLIYFGFWLAHDVSPLSVSLQLWIPLTAILGWLLLKEPLSRPAAFGMVLAFLGVVVMVADPHAFHDWPAILIGFLASAAWAFATITARRTPSIHPLKLQGIISLVAAPTLGMASAVFEHDRWGALAHADWFIWATILFAAFGSTMIATALLFWLVQRREAGRVTPYMLTSPLVSCAIGVGLMGDVLTPQIVAGSVLCIGGVGLVALAERHMRSRARTRAQTDASEELGPIA
jgi:O-acetylserine/cysteine efflux transporter